MPSCHLVPCIGGWRTAGLVQLSGISPGQPPPASGLRAAVSGAQVVPTREALVSTVSC